MEVPEPRMRPVCTQVPKDWYDLIEEVARLYGVSVSRVFRSCIEDYTPTLRRLRDKARHKEEGNAP